MTPASFTWRCRFCRTVLSIRKLAVDQLVRCPQCCQDTVIAGEGTR
jgi:phage FluMu protein Com